MVKKRNAIIYVVDDDEAVRKALTRRLKASGFAVQAYESVLSFLSDVVVLDQACLLLDIRMPGMTGLELVEHMKKTGMDIPTILITAHEEEHRQYHDTHPVLACLQKPVDEKEILDLIEIGLL